MNSRRPNDPLLQDARAVLETGPVCDCCLGRCFAERGVAITVEERGQALRTVLAMTADEPFDVVLPDTCWVCEGSAELDYDSWTERTVDAVSDIEFDTIQIGTHPPQSLAKNERELRNRAGLAQDAGWTINALIDHRIGHRLLEQVDATLETEHPDVVAVIDLVAEQVEVDISPVYLYGRYRKLRPGIAQRVRECPACTGTGTVGNNGELTCQNCDGSGRVTSIEEMVAWSVRSILGGSDVKLHTAGGEADDVLVKGTGRPFVLEVVEPRRRGIDIAEIEAEIAEVTDHRIVVDGLAYATPEIVEHVTHQPVRQRYRLTVTLADSRTEAEIEEAISTLSEASIRQRIDKGQRPHDVVRTLQDPTAERLDGGLVAFEFGVESGIDIEAIATGGAGRTEPSLASVLPAEVELESVAVVAIEGQSEAFEEPGYLLDP